MESQIKEEHENWGKKIWAKESFPGIRVPVVEVFSGTNVLIINISILAFNNGLHMFYKQKHMAPLKMINCIQIRYAFEWQLLPL